LKEFIATNLVCLILALPLVQANGTVFEAVDLWPGEGRPVFKASAQDLTLRASPSNSSRVSHRVMVQRKQPLKFDHTLYRTIKAGRIRVLMPAYLEGRILGARNRLSTDEYYSDKFPSSKMPVKPGRDIEYLQYRAEGTCFVRIESVVIDASSCPTTDRSAFRLETEPTTEWWIHVIVDQTAGWLLVTDSNVKEVGREF